MADKETQSTKIALIQKDIGFIKETMKDMKDSVGDVKEQLGSQYVSKDEFEPIKKLVYGVVGLFLTGIVGAILALVIRS